MNQEKIGKFILKLRREKNMTQQELADRIGVTDRAISKWENGRGLPDLSLMMPLCKELGITINELISGEQIEKEDYQSKLEENIFKTIDYTNRKFANKNKIFKIVVGTIITIVLIVGLMFFVDVNRMNNNDPVVFSTWGFKYAPLVDFHEEKIISEVENYLLEKSDNEPKHHENEKSFVSIRTYLIEEKNKHKLYNVYAWVLEEKYYLENNKIKQDSSSSIPYMFVVEQTNDKYKVTDSRIPRDKVYTEDMKNIFPRSVRKDMDEIHNDGTIKKLKMDIEKQLNLYFHK
ncbi:MAG TPA: helix-turn-helix domain-containing protein [Bacilli bacterium]|nr:helix-turn-helix domain-containing protein [Bacilli bacterium]